MNSIDTSKSYSEMRSSKMTPVNAHHPNDRRWILGTDSMKNNVIMNAKISPAFFSKLASFI